MHENILSLPNKIEFQYPIWKSCSYLGKNYYEEISSQFEEVLSDALLPENSCLLNDRRYPLQYIDEFYKSPWTNAEREEEFFVQESKKVEEYLLELSGNRINFDELFINIFNKDTIEIVDESDNFEKLNLQELRSALQYRKENAFLEVPYISNTVLSNKISCSIEDLIEKLPVMELENIFEQETSFLNMSEIFKLSPMKEDSLPEYEDFKELDLTDGRTKDFNLPNSVSCTRAIFCSDITHGSYSKDISDTQANKLTFDVEMQSSVDLNPVSDAECNLNNVSEDIYNQEISFNINDNFFEDNCDLLPENDSTLKTGFFCAENNTPSQMSPPNDFICSSLPTDTKVFNGISDHELVYKNQDFLNSPSEILEMPKNILVQNSQRSCSSEVLPATDTHHKEPFLDKLHGLDIKRSVKTSFQESRMLVKVPIGHSKLSGENSLVSKFNFRKNALTDTSTNYKSLKIDANNVVSQENATYNRYSVSSPYFSSDSLHEKSFSENLIDTSAEILDNAPTTKAFNLLSSLLVVRKGNMAEPLMSSPKYFHHQPLGMLPKDWTNYLDEVTRNKNIIAKNISSPVPSSEAVFEAQNVEDLQPKESISIKDIIVKFPDDYVAIILAHEHAAVYYTQKLLCFRDFQFLQDLTLIDLSLDKICFLLNQEDKSCRDRKLNPFQGGIQYSYYMQMLVFCCILKSLNCCVHFGAELSLSALHDFRNKHPNIAKDCIEHLTGKISSFIHKSSGDNFIHQKIKDLCMYLQEKYYFCKDTLMEFKVLIILKQYLSFFYTRFERFMKTLLTEIIIELIPENYVHQKDSDIFRVETDFMYVVSTSSLTKDLPWNTLTFVIEYENDCNSVWQTICFEKNVAYASVKLDSLPLKTLKEISNLPEAKDVFHKKSETRKHIIVISSSILSEYNAKNTLNRKNIAVYERSYEMYLPDFHFADVAVDHKTCILTLNLMSFLNEDFSKLLNDKISYLQLKYEVCWIITLEDSPTRYQNKPYLLKIEGRFLLFLMDMNLISSKHFKIMFLYTKSVSDVLKCINHIVIKSMHRIQNDAYVYPENSLPNYLSNEELFLLSFPSLNPIVVSFMLSSKISLASLICLTTEELCGKFPYISRRFFEHFHSVICKNCETAPTSMKQVPQQTNGFKLSPDASFLADSPQAMQLCVDTDDYVISMTNSALNRDYNIFSTDLLEGNCSSLCSQLSTPLDYSNMSVEDIDRSYQELRLKDIDMLNDITTDEEYENLFPSDVQNSKQTFDIKTPNIDSPNEQKFFISPIDEIKSLAVNELPDTQSPVNNKCSIYFQELDPNTYSPSNVSYEPISNCSKMNKQKQKVSFLLDNESPPRKRSPEVNFSQFKYKKRKPAKGESPTKNKLRKMSVNNSGMFLRSFRVQKGQCSKTVCKDSAKLKDCNPPRNSHYSCVSLNSVPQFELASFQTVGDLEKSSSMLSQDFNSSWMSQRSIPLTPRQTQKLSYEKIPGSNGQTRLVFQ